MASVRQAPTPEELRGAAEHLWYEWYMFASLAKLLAMAPFGQGVVTNGLLEAFTIHARVLLDFLFKPKPGKDDVSASHYFPSSAAWERVRGEMPHDLDALNRRVGKEVVHLTYARLQVKPTDKPWAFLKIAQAMRGCLRVWVTNVDSALLGGVNK